MKLNLQVFLQTKGFRKMIVIICSVAIFLLILFFSFRNMVLHHIIENKINTFNQKYPATLLIEDSRFTGFTGVELSGVRIIPDKSDTLFSSASVYVKLKFFPLLIGKVRVGDMEISGTNVNLIKRNTVDNYSFLLSQTPKEQQPGETNYASRLDRLSGAVFDQIPENFTLKNFLLNVKIDNDEVSMSVKKLEIEDHWFKAPIKVTEGEKENVWIAEGNINKGRRTAGIRLYPESGKVMIPMVKKRWGLLLSFDTLRVGISENSYNNGCFVLSGYASVSGLLLNYRRISLNNVKMEKTAFDYHFRIGKDFIELDSTSFIVYNKLELNPYILYQNADTKKYTFKINNEFFAQDFFESLPAGLFTNFEGIKTSGRLKLFVDFYIDMKLPDSLKFNAGLSGKDFKVVKYGTTDFTKINGPFTFTAYENGNPVKSFVLDSENSEFTPLDEISTCLKEAVLVSENGGYYFASGFDIGSLRLSIIENIKQKRFVRGGSTIEMQLVKNVFLNKNKTIARKVEELLIVWLMQSGNLCNKDRMYEVYLNVIEWGPGVYGVYEASKYYFNKHPSKLSLAESIFLASIIPKPKWFKYSFDEKGRLISEQNQAYFSKIASLLLEKAIIAIEDTNKLLPKVRLNGAAKMDMVRDTAHFKMDSLMLYND